MTYWGRALAADEIAAVYDARSAFVCKDTLYIKAPAQFPGAAVGVPYSQTVLAALGTPPYVFSLAGGSSPPGLAVQPAGLLAGVPTTPGQYTFVVQAKDAGGQVAQTTGTMTVYACAPRLPGLVAWWTGDGSADDWVGTAHGTRINAAGFAPGKARSAFANLNARENYIRIAPERAPNVYGGSHTVENWVYVGGFYTEWNPVSAMQLGNFGLWYNANGRYLRAHVWFGANQGRNLDVGFSFPIARWMHVAQVWDADAGTLAIYANGELLANAAGSQWSSGHNNINNTRPILIGKSWNEGEWHNYIASFDEVGLYNRALSAEEIRMIYQADLAGKCLPPPEADLMAKLAGEDDAAFALNNVYQPVPEGGQVKTKWVTPLTTTSHAVKLENDGAAERSFVLRTVESNEPGWSIAYKAGEEDISAALRSPEGLVLANMPPGGSFVLTVDVIPAPTQLGFASKAATVQVLYDPVATAVRDAVRLVAVNTPSYQPDLLVRREIDVVPAGKHVYNLDAAGQTKATETDAAVPAVYYVQVVNDGNLTNQFLLRGGECSDGWLVRYFDAAAGGNDITTEIADAGLMLTLPIGASREFRVEVVPKSRLPGGATRDLFMTATSLISADQADTARMITTVSADAGFPLRGVYTSGADFEKGMAAGVEWQSVPGQLQLGKEAVTLPFIWVPNSNEGTVSKVDTRTGQELGRYRTGPVGHANPSRTTVDIFGDCWVCNRNIGTAVKIGLYENGQYVDRNGDGIIQTSQDLNGDGDITGGEILPWGRDECVMWEVYLWPGSEATHVPGAYTGWYPNDSLNPGPRGIAMDASGNLWVGTYATKKFYYLDGNTGQILRTVDLAPVDHTCYGAVIDAQGILWSSPGATKPVLRLDPKDDSVSLVDVGHFVYGLGLDRNNHLFVSGWQNSKLSRVNVLTGQKDWTVNGFYESRGVASTDDGDVWVANSGPGTVTRWSNDGVVKATIAVGSQPTGVSVDAAGKVWAVNVGDEYIHRIDPRTDQVDLAKRLIGATHYGYSDMTGIIARNVATRIGVWTVIHNSRNPNTAWDYVAWNSLEPPGTSLKVKVRSSSDRVNWSVWEEAANGEPLQATPRGKFLQVQVLLQILSGDDSPALYDLTVVPLIDVLPVHPADSHPADNVLSVGEVIAYAAAWKKGETWPVAPVIMPISYVSRAGALYRGGGRYVYDSNILTAPLWWVSDSVGVPGGELGTAVGELPAACAPDVPFTVAINAAPAATVRAYAVQDLPPVGWTVCAISDGGEFDDLNRQVKWGPFFDAQPRTLAYVVTPPGNASGAGVFSGVASFDGVDAGVTGQRSVRVQGSLASSTAVASMPERYAPGASIPVSIVVTPSAEANIYAVQDVLPAGWVASAINHGGVFEPASRAVVWGPFWDAAPRTLTYTATSPAGPGDLAVFAGTAWFDTAEVPITGQRQAQPQAAVPARFVSARMLSNGQFQAAVVGTAGQSYQILASMDLVTWQPLGAVEIGANGQALFTDDRAAANRAFYRAVLAP